jgi:hypothetical protein
MRIGLFIPATSTHTFRKLALQPFELLGRKFCCDGLCAYRDVDQLHDLGADKFIRSIHDHKWCLYDGTSCDWFNWGVLATCRSISCRGDYASCQRASGWLARRRQIYDIDFVEVPRYHLAKAIESAAIDETAIGYESYNAIVRQAVARQRKKRAYMS